MTNVGRSTETWLNGTCRTGRSEGKVLDVMTKVAKGSEVMDQTPSAACHAHLVKFIPQILGS